MREGPTQRPDFVGSALQQLGGIVMPIVAMAAIIAVLGLLAWFLYVLPYAEVALAVLRLSGEPWWLLPAGPFLIWTIYRLWPRPTIQGLRRLPRRGFRWPSLPAAGTGQAPRLSPAFLWTLYALVMISDIAARALGCLYFVFWAVGGFMVVVGVAAFPFWLAGPPNYGSPWLLPWLGAWGYVLIQVGPQVHALYRLGKHRYRRFCRFAHRLLDYLDELQRR